MLTALVSGTYSYDYYEQVVNAEAQRAAAETELERSRKGIDELKRFLVPVKPVVRAEDQLDRFLVSAWDAVEKNGISADVSVRSERGALGVLPISSYYTNVPNTEVKTVRISVTGRYSSYADFKNFLSSLEQSGGFLSKIRIKESSFELTYQIYGG